MSFNELKETSRDSDESSAPVLCDSNKDATNSDYQATPIPRAASTSKPTPKPRPRSLVVEKDPIKQAKDEETAEKPIAPPRSKSKPSREDSEAGSQKNLSTKGPNPEPPHRQDLNPPPPVKPKPASLRNKPPTERRPSSSVCDNESITVTTINASGEDTTSKAQDLHTGQEEIKGSSEVEPSKGENKKARPPPIPRRVDLD